MEKMLKMQICSQLGISEATFNNWQTEGIIPSEKKEEQTFTEADFDVLLDTIKANAANKLSARANRLSSTQKRLSYQGIKTSQRKKLLEQVVEKTRELPPQAAVLAAIICQLNTENLLSGKTAETVHAWLATVSKKTKLPQYQIEHFLDGTSIPNQNDDFLGALYQSLQSTGEKAGTGSFYTPPQVLSDLQMPPQTTVYDPCCGSGNILLNVLTREHNPAKIYASDVDQTALMICHTNLVMFFGNPDVQLNIFEQSFLEPAEKAEQQNRQYDVIITNPPWGARFTAEEKSRLAAQYKQLNTTETFSICLFNATKLLAPHGKMIFFLPSSFLNVAAHKKIREYLLNMNANITVKFLGAAFKGVFSKTILLQVQKVVPETQADFIDVIAGENAVAGGTGGGVRSYHVARAACHTPGSVWPLLTTPEESAIIEKVYSFPHVTLEGGRNCIFGMGIVTGNNGRFIQDAGAVTGVELKMEPVYRGKNIVPYKILPATEKILFEPELFHQCAPAELYRAKKIVYRFIYDRPVCAVSDGGELFLNSANFFIPELEYPWETIVALFNSDLYAFIYKKKFDSVKILRQHLEQLPLPLFTAEQHAQIKKLYEQAAGGGTSVAVEALEKLLRSYLGVN